jgi:hypothetical protein
MQLNSAEKSALRVFPPPPLAPPPGWRQLNATKAHFLTACVLLSPVPFAGQAGRSGEAGALGSGNQGPGTRNQELTSGVFVVYQWYSWWLWVRGNRTVCREGRARFFLEGGGLAALPGLHSNPVPKIRGEYTTFFGELTWSRTPKKYREPGIAQRHKGLQYPDLSHWPQQPDWVNNDGNDERTNVMCLRDAVGHRGARSQKPETKPGVGHIKKTGRQSSL